MAELPAPPPRTPSNRPIAGALWMLVTGFSFVAVTAIVKHGAQDLPAAELGGRRVETGVDEVELGPARSRSRRLRVGCGAGQRHGALGRGAWRLLVSRDEAVLTLADGEVYRAASVDRLIAEQIGWPVPVAELSWWIRGLAAPVGRSQRSLGEAGELLDLQQAGWSIEFNRYRVFDDELMPGLVVARRGERLVKFVVGDWTLPGGGVVDG